ncbi:hypothetical protein ACIBI4_04240 [Streptomyces sp. NPDC050418]|uniref:hypothetical protein n=1 Tax=Streptomyces sp. NPDC050418 TaxID=3365612 RepID=UPI0037B64004
MGGVDRKYIPALRQDGRYQRLFDLTERIPRRQLNQRLAVGLHALEDAHGHLLPHPVQLRDDHDLWVPGTWHFLRGNPTQVLMDCSSDRKRDCRGQHALGRSRP